MLLFAIIPDLGYSTFIDSNEKFITLFVRVFTKNRCHAIPLLLICPQQTYMS